MVYSNINIIIKYEKMYWNESRRKGTKKKQKENNRRYKRMGMKFNKIIWSFRYAVHGEYAIPRIFAVSISLPSNGWLALDRCHTGAYNL